MSNLTIDNCEHQSDVFECCDERTQISNDIKLRVTCQTLKAMDKLPVTIQTASIAVQPTWLYKTGEEVGSRTVWIGNWCLRSTIINQDDCLAINKGSNIVFQRNTCMDGHGISIVRLLPCTTHSAVAWSVLGFYFQWRHRIWHCDPRQYRY